MFIPTIYRTFEVHNLAVFYASVNHILHSPKFQIPAQYELNKSIFRNRSNIHNQQLHHFFSTAPVCLVNQFLNAAKRACTQPQNEQ